VSALTEERLKKLAAPFLRYGLSPNNEWCCCECEALNLAHTVAAEAFDEAAEIASTNIHPSVPVEGGDALDAKARYSNSTCKIISVACSNRAHELRGDSDRDAKLKDSRNRLHKKFGGAMKRLAKE